MLDLYRWLCSHLYGCLTDTHVFQTVNWEIISRSWTIVSKSMHPPWGILVEFNILHMLWVIIHVKDSWASAFVKQMSGFSWDILINNITWHISYTQMDFNLTVVVYGLSQDNTFNGELPCSWIWSLSFFQWPTYGFWPQ